MFNPAFRCYWDLMGSNGIWCLSFPWRHHDVFIFILFKGIEGSPGIMIIICQVVLKAHPMHHFTNASAHKHTHTDTHLSFAHLHIYILYTSYIHLTYILYTFYAS